MIDCRAQNGVALVVTVMAVLVVGALGVAVLLGTASESMMAANFERSMEAQYAAEGALECAVSEALVTTDWNSLLNGVERSSFVDGSAGGVRWLAEGSRVDLSEIVNIANCGRTASCAEDELTAASPERPWGMNNPRWQLYAHGPMGDLVAAHGGASQFYVVVLVGDDPAENDDAPLVDGGPPVTGEPENRGADVITLRSEAFGPRGAHARVDATLRREGGIAAWRVVR